MPTTLKTKPAGFKPGLAFLAIFTFAMGALGVYGWVQAEVDTLTKAALGFAAGATALVIPFTVIALGRSYASAGVVPVLLVCFAMQAVSFHNFYGVVIEAPHKAAFETGLQPLKAEVTRTTGRLEAAEAALDAFPALVLPDCLCPKTTAAKTASWEAQRAPLAKAVETAKADRSDAITALSDAEAAYSPLAPDWAVWLVGAILDGSIALAIWSLEATARQLRREHAAELAKAEKAEARRIEREKAEARARREANRKAKEKAAAKAAKAKPDQGFKPFLIAAND